MNNKTRLNHYGSCSGDLICSKCGRKGCFNCLFIGKYKSLCLVCSGKYKEGEILLYPVPAKEWDARKN